MESIGLKRTRYLHGYSSYVTIAGSHAFNHLAQSRPDPVTLHSNPSPLRYTVISDGIDIDRLVVHWGFYYPPEVQAKPEQVPSI